MGAAGLPPLCNGAVVCGLRLLGTEKLPQGRRSLLGVWRLALQWAQAAAAGGIRHHGNEPNSWKPGVFPHLSMASQGK